MRAWLLTWTTYGTWLPGDKRGSVTRVRESIAPRTMHNKLSTPYDSPMPALQETARAAMKGQPVLFTHRHAEVVKTQFIESASYRGWRLLAVAVMHNHVHLVVVADDAVDSAELLRTFKSYASRALNAEFSKPQAGRWWTVSASRRSLPDERAIRDAVRYVREQPGALVVYIAPAE